MKVTPKAYKTQQQKQQSELSDSPDVIRNNYLEDFAIDVIIPISKQAVQAPQA